MKARIRCNQYGNWYGYIGNKKVISFMNTPFDSQEQQAQSWLESQKLTSYRFTSDHNIETIKPFASDDEAFSHATSLDDDGNVWIEKLVSGEWLHWDFTSQTWGRIVNGSLVPA